jgi:beta-glucosidase/6-phospho-beta-glucosidase/beta-galactosidase
LDPVIFGKYPKEMENVLGSLLPKFSTNEKNKLKKGLDFIGINYYTASYVQDCIYTKCDSRFGISRTEGSYMKSAEKNGVSIGESVRTLKLIITNNTLKIPLEICKN